MFSMVSHMSASLMPGLMMLCAYLRTVRCTSAASRSVWYRSSLARSSARFSALQRQPTPDTYPQTSM